MVIFVKIFLNGVYVLLQWNPCQWKSSSFLFLFHLLTDFELLLHGKSLFSFIVHWLHKFFSCLHFSNILVFSFINFLNPINATLDFISLVRVFLVLNNCIIELLLNVNCTSTWREEFHLLSAWCSHRRYHITDFYSSNSLSWSIVSSYTRLNYCVPSFNLFMKFIYLIPDWFCFSHEFF